MTRETKVGIVVSCSFLGLVGVVIASKLREQPPASSQEQATSQLADEKPAAVRSGAPQLGKLGPGPMQAKGSSTIPKAPPQAEAEPYPPLGGGPKPDGLVPPQPLEGVWRVPGSPAVAESKPPAGDPAPVPKSSDVPVSESVVNNSNPLREAVAELAAQAKDEGPMPPSPPSAILAPAPLPPPDKKMEAGGPDPLPPLSPTGADVVTAPQQAVPASGAIEKDSNPLREAVAELAKEVKDERTVPHASEAVAVVPASPLPAPPPEGSGTAPSAPPLTTGATGPMAPPLSPPPSAVVTEDSSKQAQARPGLSPSAGPMTTPATPPSSGTSMDKPVTPPSPGEVGLTTPPSTPTPTPTPAVPSVEKPEKPPSSVPEAPPVSVPVPTKEPEKKEPPREVSPAAPRVVASTPGLPVPPVGARPTVESFTEQEYVIKANDTFEKISEKFYQTRDYAEALRLYNRNDSLLSDLGRDGTGALKPGLHLSIPQWQILKKRYGGAIPGVRPAGATAPATGPETSNKVPLPPKDATPPPPKPVTYRVPAGDGKAMYDIAKTLLGNGDRWTEIHNLNQQYDPALKIPAGREVRLPADAAGQP